ncbi:hypothetical protein [Oceanispirochaeta sp.]|jgi:colicin import membrane protein|uniref:hypothetical protein n=1 Tax=Oceanispirochaeta sp. TaxID=2035350 RepID=UPI0026339A8C|nr:hypothetical protein [Oceanispirochaeta sp.]MDA3957338.1 hypothetical protein [Oceanispirochaeta sp.]
MNELTITTELKDLTPEKSAQIKAVFFPMVKMLERFEEKYNQVVAMDPGEETSKIAKRLRLDIGKIRTEADKARKKEKDKYLRAGNAIQGVYNVLKDAVTDKEEKLKEIETHYERIEAERIRVLQEERQEILYQYNPDHPFIDLGSMPSEVWNNFILGTKAAYDAKLEAERKAEADRLAAIEAERIENERIRLENEQLRKEAEEREALRAKEEAARIKKEKATQEKIDAENKAHDEALRKEREAREKLEAEASFKRAEEDERLRAEEARKAKEESDQRESARKAANAPDKEKLETIARNLMDKVNMFSSDEAIWAIEKASEILKDAAYNL